jgi:hypothetical protein
MVQSSRLPQRFIIIQPIKESRYTCQRAHKFPPLEPRLIKFTSPHPKAKSVPLHSMKALGWKGGIAPTHSRPRYRWGELSASPPGRALVPRKWPPVPIVQEAGWAPEPVWIQRLRGKTLSPLPGIEPLSPGPTPRSQTLY